MTAWKEVSDLLDFIENSIFLFCVNFKPNIQAAVIINLFLKPEDLCVVSFST